MKVLIVLIIIGGLAFWGYTWYEEREGDRPAQDETERTERRSPSSGPLADYVGANIQARDTAERTVNVSGLNQTISQFESMEGRFPEDLEELVTEGYLPEIPSAPRGQKLDYDPETGRVTVVDE